ncbi:glycerol acyltransferase [Paraliobacillus quinghaiensis]|uniref:Glycerol acyltransferase n=1 Tax=Paraliobacillus quinghaiensis TaxID=470815 RepID=A0A917WYI8_9BACI|nr:lysophospholipid acyltransferase family protein [Paraliobacillus quinghaiensis]GGM40751.1 glycerol acyltransferase [Paraliobacillus quinghaiensis]
MITAAKNKHFSKLFYLYLQKYLLKRHFYTVVAEGEIDTDQKGPVIYIANHSSWWDGLLLFYLTQQQSAQHHFIMMDEEGLKQYPFFRKLGAFSIDRDQPKGIVQSLKYSQKLVEQNGSVWLFPQGEVQHQDIRPLQFQSGIGYLLERFERITVKPVTFYYSFGEMQKPIASIHIGDDFSVNGTSKSRKEWTAYFQNVLEKQANAQRKKIVENLDFYQLPSVYQVIKPSKSTSDHLNRWKEGVQRWMPFS